jgi:hypothetical protein
MNKFSKTIFFFSMITLLSGCCGCSEHKCGNCGGDGWVTAMGKEYPCPKCDDGCVCTK